MKKLNVQDRLEYARCAVAVLRALKITDRTMRYNELARAIGLMSDSDRWEPWHRQQIEAILQIAHAVEQQRWGGEATDISPLEFERIVTEDGLPGAGVVKNSRITRD